MASCHTHAATKLSSHRSFWQRRASHRIHRSFWRKIFSHGFHGCTQIRRVWHPCHTHAATKLSSHRSFWWRSASHRIHRIHRIFWRKIFSDSRFCGFCEFCGRICAVCLVGALETSAPPGRVAWVWQDAIPSYENSHRLHGCTQIRRQKRNLKICEHL